MDFVSAVKSCFAQYAGFSGRAPRSEFWWFAPPFCDIPPGNPQGLKMPLVHQLRAAMQAGRCGATRYDGVWVDVGTPERLAAIAG